MTIFPKNLAVQLERLRTVAPIEREEGQTLAEYALILALIAIVVAGALTFLQGDISSLFSTVADSL
jgi:pilus assembly protein Flp/PilA